MPSGGRSLTQRAERPGRDPGPTRIKPLYKRLPHGPHRMARDEVILNQRARIYGAMIEAVADCGYDGTSVKQVISLAGVSRRSFYEQFSNKQESFLATFDLLAHQAAQQSRDAYLNTDGRLDERLRVAFRRLTEIVSDEPKAASLVLVEAQTAGAAGTLRLCRGIATCEQMLSRSFLEAPEASALPTPIVRGIAGGLHQSVSDLIRRGPLHDSVDAAEDLVRWTMLFQGPTASELAERLAPRLTRRMREISLNSARPVTEAQRPSVDDRERLMQNALRLAALHEYRELTAPQIADEAGVSIDVFLEHFADRDECYLAAFESIGSELLAIAAGSRQPAADWPQAVRRTLAELMRHLAEHPLQARTIAQQAFFAGPRAVERDLELARELARALVAGAPTQAPGEIVLEGIAGAIWHTVRCQVASGRIQLLGALSDYLAYIVLAPFIGVEAAVELLVQDPAT
jgi:AcrR family transcriptional regulator